MKSPLATYVGFVIVTLVALALIQNFNIAYPVTITTKAAPVDLAVVGEGKVDIVPDTASVDLGIIANNTKTVDEAQGNINKVNNAIIEGVKVLGIDQKDVKTSNYSISPNYNYANGNNTISGYNGNATVTIKVRDTSKLPQVIEIGTKAGANQVIGTNYSVDKPENYREKARQAAIDNAKQQAEKIAGQLGIRLGKIVNIVESGNTGGGPVPMMFDKAMLGAGGTNIPSADLQPGTQTITSTVTLYFEKK